MADSPTPANRVHGLLTPQNCTVIFIDHQPQMAFGVTSIDRQLLINNTVGLAKSAKIFARRRSHYFHFKSFEPHRKRIKRNCTIIFVRCCDNETN